MITAQTTIVWQQNISNIVPDVEIARVRVFYKEGRADPCIQVLFTKDGKDFYVETHHELGREILETCEDLARKIKNMI